MNKKEVKDLLLKYQSGQCTEKEGAIVENWLFYENKTDFNLSDQELKQNLIDLDFRMGLNHNVKKHNFIRTFAAAAAIFLVVCTGLYFYTSAPAKNDIKGNTLSVTKDIGPGGNFATLTLSDGKSIDLNTGRDRVLVQNNGLSIVNTKNSQLIYTANNVLDLSKINHTKNNFSTNLLKTPRGGQYQVTLSDGTKVWLNSASSLKFPAQFIGEERLVQLTGEAYFEVAKNPAMPFKVTVNSTTVKVLGTHFNISAYGDLSSTKTTLLEGSIQLSNGKANKVLKPNQQGVIDNAGSIKITDIDPEQAVAWKNGYFSFKRTSLPEIMQQISRWYNIEVIFHGKVSNEQDLFGKIKRNSNLSKTLELLEFSGVRFKVKDRQVIVTPKKQ
ncbi:FecR family protein [Pedobacter sp. WC2423]|uniref:FecR family protein n=1 Tax=Pedobacter sp. WC2423 TaxID=3234142 RepID=UPI0034662622